MSPGERRRVLAVAGAAAFVNFMAFLGLTPLYPQVARDLHVGPDGLGVFFAASSVTGAVLQIPVGVLADRVGRRPVLVAGLLAATVAQLLRWQATTPLVFAAGQVFVGACSPLITAAAYAVVADAYGRTGRGQAIGIVSACINLGQVSGYLLAGVLGPLIGWRGYSLSVALLPLLLLPAVFLMPEPEPAGNRGASMARGIGDAIGFLFSRRPATLAVMAALALGAGFAATYLFPFVLEQHGLSTSATSLLLLPYIAGSVAGAPIAGRFADRIGTAPPMLVLLVGGAAATAAFALLPFSVPLTLVLFALVGAANNGTLSLASTAIVEIAVSRGAGTGAAIGGLRVGQQLGPSAGPALGGIAYVHGGQPAGYGVLAALFALAAVLLALIRPTRAPGRAST